MLAVTRSQTSSFPFCFSGKHLRDRTGKDRSVSFSNDISMNTPVGGRLELFLQNWRAIRRDPWILDTVQGIRLDFLTTPVQSYLPNPYFHKKADQDMIDAEVMNLVQKNAVCSGFKRKGVVKDWLSI